MSLNPEHLSPKDSLLARRDGRWRLLALVLAAVGIAILRDPGPIAASGCTRALAAITAEGWMGMKQYHKSCGFAN